MIEASNLTKRYGPFTAVSGISFTIPVGEVVGFIGPNGAGKTSTMRMLTGFLPATEGTAVVAGHDVFEEPRKVKQKVGYLPEVPPLYVELTVGQYLSFVAELRGVSRSKRLGRVGVVMEQVGLTGWEDRIVGSLSKGFRQRVGIAQALVHDPEVLILDEPTSGLDPVQTEGVRALIGALSADRTIILSTHLLREVEALCSRVIMIDQGRIAADGSIESVRTAAGGAHYRLRLAAADETPFSEPAKVALQISALDSVTQVEPVDGGVFKVWSPVDPRPEVVALSAEKGWRVYEVEQHLPSLEEAFMCLVENEK